MRRKPSFSHHLMHFELCFLSVHFSYTSKLCSFEETSDFYAHFEVTPNAIRTVALSKDSIPWPACYSHFFRTKYIISMARSLVILNLLHFLDLCIHSKERYFVFCNFILYFVILFCILFLFLTCTCTLWRGSFQHCKQIQRWSWQSLRQGLNKSFIVMIISI